MSRLMPLIRQTVPVVSHRRERAAPAPPVLVPEVGLRWGAASRFEFGQWPEPLDETEPIIRYRGNVDKEIVIQGVESHREFSRESIDVGNGVIFEVEGIDSVTFYLGERQVETEEREVKYGVTYIQPVVETIEEYLKFDFKFLVAGERGEPHPPETPELEPAKLYEAVSDASS